MTNEELFALDIEQNVKDIDSGEDDSYYRGRLAGMLSAYRILTGKPYDDGDLISRLAVKAEIDKLPRIKVGNSNSPTVKYCVDETLLYDLLEQPKEKTERAVYNFFDDPIDIVEFINEHHIKKEDIVGITHKTSVCLGSTLFRYYLIYFEEERE